VKKGFSRPEYHTGIADCVTPPAIPPMARQIIMDKIIAKLF
jgi:hypothetical protein